MFDEIFSDISFHGWEQDPEERAMIIEHPKLFPNFYAVPTRWLDRRYLREVREFLLHGIAKTRWLMVLLHRESGDLLSVFDEWVAWSARARSIDGVVDTSRSYYSGDLFPRDLTRFVESRHLKRTRHPHIVRTIVDLETAFYAFSGPREENHTMRISFNDLNAKPVVADDARVLMVQADYNRLMRALKRKERFDSIPNAQVPLGLIKGKDDIKVVQLTQTSYELIQLCDGSRTIKQIAGKFSAGKKLGVSPLKASVYGLASLARQGFINVAPVGGN